MNELISYRHSHNIQNIISENDHRDLESKFQEKRNKEFLEILNNLYYDLEPVFYQQSRLSRFLGRIVNMFASNNEHNQIYNNVIISNIETNQDISPENYSVTTVLVSKDFTCPVCLEEGFAKLNKFPCNHMMCEGCLSNMAIYKLRTCPCCRSDITT